jgi:hypothetical protein
MTKNIVFAAVSLTLLSGCDGLRQHQKERAEIGRFQYYPPAGDMPAVLLDTVTGCVETFEKTTAVENPKDVKWWRQYADTGMPNTTYENGELKMIPNTTPPSRCPKEAKK